MGTTLFAELAVILAVATAMALLMRALRQPLVIGHILTGLLVGPFVLDLIESDELFKLFGELGVAFLLFTVGLNLTPKVLKDFGPVALITGFGQVIFTTLAGFLISRLLGFGVVEALYISVALAFSSTIIILKLLSDRGDLEKVYAKIAIGFLLVQDLIAVLLLFTLPLLAAGGGGLMVLPAVLIKAALLGAAVFGAAQLIARRLGNYLAGAPELLFLFAASWGLGIALLFQAIGFSLETGALVAGVALSLLPARQEINARLAPLRDFFIVLFFVLLGAQMAVGDLGPLLWPAAALAILVLVGNPLILMIIMGFLGYRRKTSLQTGFTVAQISEFSLILIALGVMLGHVSPVTQSMLTLVGLVTIFGSTYLILYSDFWYRRLAPYLKIFERAHLVREERLGEAPRLFLFGANRIGHEFTTLFKRTGEPFLVVDHDPEVVRELRAKKIEALLGDAGDIDFLKAFNLARARLIVSTIPDLAVNLLVLEASRERRGRPVVMVVAHSISNALALYEAGATYVILPHFLGGQHAAGLAERLLGRGAKYQTLREQHVKYLRRRAALGHEHPVLERYR